MNRKLEENNKTVVENYIKNNSHYKINEPFKFDLRGYASYVEEHKLEAKDITDDILSKFSRI